MLRFLVRRAISVVTALFFVVTLTFFMMKAIPGGPFDADKKLPPAIQKNLEEKYHLNDPLYKQYLDYLKGVVTWNLGPSFKEEGVTVNDIIKTYFPVSATLGAVAVAFSLIVGIISGIIAALRHNKWQDYLAMILSTIGFAVPSFILATLLMYVFALKLQWFPAAMWGSWENVVLPALALSGMPTAVIARFMRSSMLEVLQQDYIKTAKAKGLSERVIIYRHALRNALMPIITYLGPLVAGIFTGSFVVEHIFAIPGLGRYFVTSISNRDYTVIMGLTIFYSIFLVLMNLLVDLAYAAVDPRIKLVEKKG
ncbi:oligopeptide transport system permease protein [Carboxydocella sporoproducens DSM 16521]|uniref:Oligopeptide transport system permease protein n=2 Tax=Carboxydocella TaxID=178898 RepID=A0A1T4L9L1_9FIRM|nr:MULTISPECIES: ABC transporter permease [Carboxydocella]AVX19892.1 oligopeptide transport system permease protein [Carboxydocella thermautotrophica]SJZ51386.1 oligopeptide transport system permease protein [Carboxydocella sporoproducens DSM 16521]